ncbi:4-oxalocrotonate tautomerase family protein (plasmid) [Rhodococcus qingshengii]|uniref:tautomerase family protein n=1 Tax=Rhodococcus TaxID=1827 RepID=UPI000F62525F|nr:MULTISPECIES: 4-oxalocrotonate tautomerase family protein [Rhodococcus]AZI65868.1 4-oxalocrotonate tautomerase family protein [Rhodococcus sp. NJ-530]BDQ23821.1 4-oxalocrotonate tautomerase family protein [Rhodococcus qingshengii]
MPLIQVTLAAGRSPEQLDALGKALTTAAEQSIGAPRETIRVVLTECEPALWFAGGESLAALRASGKR